ncbi:MAG: peptide ABC transporter substrate-binding protein [Wenzhouxiangellaceae bacterium]|nr:peptide ABC transporter substrate-binding protein [Wenzhouxiangellaceae bacterium]
MRSLLLILLVLSAFATDLAGRDGVALQRGLGPSPDSLDPHRAQGLAAFNLLRDLHEGLLARDAAGRAVPGVAHRWSISPDLRTWTFELDENARWSDGRRIAASDFGRGSARARDPATASPTARWLDAVTAIRAPDSSTVILELDRPVPWLEELLTLPVAVPWRGSDLYSGPFRLVRAVPGSRFELERNPHYREAVRVAPDSVTWHVTEDPSSELARFRAGELHVTETVPPGRTDWLHRELGDRLRIAPYLGSFYLAFNLRRPPFEGNAALRRALSLAVDREILTERVLGSGELPAFGLVPPGLDGWPDDTHAGARLDQAARLAQARALFREAGYGPRRPLEVELRFNSSLTHRRLAVAVAAMWKQHLGVRTRLVNEEWKVFVTNRRQGRLTEIVRGGWIADWADAANFLDNFHSASPMNYAFFDDPGYDGLLDAAHRTSGEERTALLVAAEQRLLAAQAVLPLYYYVSRHLVSEDVTGYVDNPLDIHPSRWMNLERRDAQR